jgi:hypothetical protein
MSKGKVGRPRKPPNFKELLQRFIPASDIFHEDELKVYEGLVGIYLKDFDEAQLTASDFDDIMSIAMNRVLEIRLLKGSKDNTDDLIDTSAAIEKLRKQTEKLKESLASRRKDRIDPKKYSGFSIVDLAVSFDMDKKKENMDRALKIKKDEEEVLQSKLLIGNRDDADASVTELDR